MPIYEDNSQLRPEAGCEPRAPLRLITCAGTEQVLATTQNKCNCSTLEGAA